jgi:DNA-binding XRE family transcriptional regulator
MDRSYSGHRPGAHKVINKVKGGWHRKPKPLRPVKPLEPPEAPKPVPESKKAPAPVEQPPAPEPVTPTIIDQDDLDWSRLLVEARKSWDQTIEQAAEDLDVSVTTYKRWETGKGKPNSKGQTKILEAVADYTNLDLRDFLKD